MKRSEIIETIIILVTIAALWPLIWYYRTEYIIPESVKILYKLFLVILTVALVIIFVRRIKRVKKAMRDVKRQQSKTRKFPPFF